jgi:hypothetical protein
MPQQHNASKTLLIRAAERIRDHLLPTQIGSADIFLPEHEWNQCEAILRRIRLAHSRGWRAAAASVTEELSIRVAQCAESLKEIFERLTSNRPSFVVPAVRDIFADLVALVEEFDDVSIVLSERLVAVTTAPVVLEGLALGRFQVRLDWGRIGTAHPYDIVALTPNPPRSSEDTVHPHVIDERLCEGDGKVPIARALREGRLLDFFHIVNSLLNNYNPSSAYVALSDWEGSTCVDCGDIIQADDERNCDACEGVLCGSCVVACEGCDAHCCCECTRRCESCGDDLCRGCARDCKNCGRSAFCQTCLSESDLCPDCQETANEQSEADPQPQSPQIAEAAAPTA